MNQERRHSIRQQPVGLLGWFMAAILCQNLTTNQFAMKRRLTLTPSRDKPSGLRRVSEVWKSSEAAAQNTHWKLFYLPDSPAAVSLHFFNNSELEDRRQPCLLYLSVFVTRSKIVMLTQVPALPLFKLLGFHQQNGKNKSPFGPESQHCSCAVTKLLHELFPLEMFFHPYFPFCFYHFSSS